MDAEISRRGCLVKKVHGHFDLTVSFGRHALVMFLANKTKRMLQNMVQFILCFNVRITTRKEFQGCFLNCERSSYRYKNENRVSPCRARRYVFMCFQILRHTMAMPSPNALQPV
jgi:hypothetical protein